MEGLFVVGFIAFAVLIIVAAYYQKKAAEKRRAELAALAEGLGLDFYPEGLPEPERGFWASLTTAFEDTNLGRFLSRFDGFDPFGRGHSIEMHNLIVGRRGDIDWYMFDYVYKTTQSSGKSTRTVPHPHGIVAARIDVALPGLELHPETILHRLGAKLGMQDLQFELEEFNRKYTVQCTDRKLAYDLLHPKAIEFFMERPARYWQAGGQMIVLMRAGYYEAAEIDALREEIEAFVALIPEYVRQDHTLPRVQASALD